MDDAGKGAGEEGVEDVVEDGLLLESRWFMAGGCSCRTKDTGGQGPPSPACPPTLPTWKRRRSKQGALAPMGVMLEGRTAQRNLHLNARPEGSLIFLISAQASFPPRSPPTALVEARPSTLLLSSQGPENFSLGHLNYGLPAAVCFLKTFHHTVCVPGKQEPHLVTHPGPSSWLTTE